MSRILAVVSLLVTFYLFAPYSTHSQTRTLQRQGFSTNLTADSVRLYPKVVRVSKGKTKTITAVAYNRAGAPLYNATFDSISVSDQSVASLSPVLVSGDDISTPTAPPRNLRTVTGNAAGVTYISASRISRASDRIIVIVDDPDATPMAVINSDNDAVGSVMNVRVGEPIELNAENSRGADRVVWSWGDGDKTTGLFSATHAYITPGSFSISLTITNRLGSSHTATVIVNVGAMPPPTATINVNSIAELLAAYNNATGGEHIVLPAGARWIGEISLPPRNLSDYVTIRSSAAMPSLTTRVSPTQSGLVTLEAPYGTGIPLRIQNGASKLRFVGLRFEPKYIPDSNGPSTYYLVQIGEPFTQTSTATNPTKIIFEHCVINPPDDVNVVHAVLNDGYKVSILSSWIGNIKTFGGQDSQAVVSFDGKGAHVYNNTFFEAASENIMYGGAVPSIEGLTSTNIEVRRCYFSKRLSWMNYTGGYPAVNAKNLFETKNARRLYIEGSVLENHWDAGRSQLFALVFKSAASSGMPGEFVPWAVSEDIVVENNRLSRVFGGLTTSVDNYWLEGFHGLKPNNIVVKNTLVDDLSNRWGPPGANNGGRLVQPLNVDDLQLEHVTVIDKDRTAGTAVLFVTNNNFRFTITNSIFALGGYGIFGGGVGSGMRSLNFGTGGGENGCTRDTMSTWKLSNNVMPIYGNDPSCYPNQTFQNAFPTDFQAVGFTDLAAGNYALAPSSPYRNLASDQTDPGVNWQLLTARTACTVSGVMAGCMGSNQIVTKAEEESDPVNDQPRSVTLTRDQKVREF